MIFEICDSNKERIWIYCTSNVSSGFVSNIRILFICNSYFKTVFVKSIFDTSIKPYFEIIKYCKIHIFAKPVYQYTKTVTLELYWVEDLSEKCNIFISVHGSFSFQNFFVSVETKLLETYFYKVQFV